jgi:hypothetical protein
MAAPALLLAGPVLRLVGVVLIVGAVVLIAPEALESLEGLVDDAIRSIALPF